MAPLVSVMMPCYNAASTLPRTLASLVAQTYQHWECLLVDDGSTDRPLDVAAAVRDPRIKPIRLDRNMGRSAARQAAVDRASGDLLCMLDADDWLYPRKVESQVEAIGQDPRIALVSSGMAIVDAHNELVGVRCRGPAGPPVAVGPVGRLSAPPVAFGPSMIRMELARQARFDVSLPACEDYDYLIRTMSDRYYCIVPDISYAYAENACVTLERLVRDLRLCRRIFAKHRIRYPIASRWNSFLGMGKEAVYRAGFALGQGRRLIEGRSRSPGADDRRDFLAARGAVDDVMARLFPDGPARAAEPLPPATRFRADQPTSRAVP